MPVEPTQIVVCGAGPAGLTAAYTAVQHDMQVVVLEKSAHIGGHARTEDYRGFRLDVGGHRFFTKLPEIESIWHDLMGEDFLKVQRLSRIYYRGRFFYYPLRFWNVLKGLGIWESTRILGSFLYAQLFPYPEEKSFEQWVCNRFGRRLYRIFFKTYTEKVWGIACDQIQAQWAAQRITNLTFWTALKRSLFRNNRNDVKTLIESFHYPRLGPGQLWHRMAERIRAWGGEIRLRSEVIRILHDRRRVHAFVVHTDDRDVEVRGTHYLSSMPLRNLIERLDPSPPEDVLQAARKIRYRDFLMVGLIVDRPHLFPDNWIYVHSPNVRVARIQNFKNWSRDMVPDPRKSCLGMEYFCNIGDDLWQMDDADLIELARREIERLGLARASDVEAGMVIREPYAYPVYDTEYVAAKAHLKAYLHSFVNLYPIGRNGLHRYDNQDHAMLSGILAIRNVLGERHDLWAINMEPEYHETVQATRVDVSIREPSS